MKIIYKIVLVLLFCSVSIMPQIKEVYTMFGYSVPLGKKNNVISAHAVGGSVSVKFGIAENLSLLINGGFDRYSVDQFNQLEGWGWDFWNSRYSNKIKSDLQADPNLGVIINSVQKMDLITAGFMFAYDFKPFEKLTVTPSAGCGIYFYTRRMYAEENWSKNFPEAGYTFQYGYRNFAPDKKGNPVYASGGLLLSYPVFNFISLSASVIYTHIIPTEGTMGYDSFLFGNELKTNIGLNFAY